MNIPDRSTQLYYPFELNGRLISYGWLGNVAEPTGETKPEVLSALKVLADANEVDNYCLGCHTCQICDKFHDRSSFYIRVDKPNEIVAVLPRMVIHYIAEHMYILPLEIQHAAIETLRSLPPLIVNYRFDRRLRLCGYEPIREDGSVVIVRGIAPAMNLSDLSFCVQRTVVLE
jgi:hypothetical protein